MFTSNSATHLNFFGEGDRMQWAGIRCQWILIGTSIEQWRVSAWSEKNNWHQMVQVSNHQYSSVGQWRVRLPDIRWFGSMTRISSWEFFLRSEIGIKDLGPKPYWYLVGRHLPAHRLASYRNVSCIKYFAFSRVGQALVWYREIWLSTNFVIDQKIPSSMKTAVIELSLYRTKL